LLTDQLHYVVGSPQLGPGKDPSGDDFGRYGVTQADQDRYAFRTPPLRNVTLTGPWFHAGPYTTLEGAVRHYLDAATALREYDVTQLAPAVQGEYYDDAAAIEDRIARLDPSLQTGIVLIPASVPSGLPVD
jgi:cytochrome c peroxidase